MTQGLPPFADRSSGPGSGEWVVIGAAAGWLAIAAVLWFVVPGLIGVVGVVLPLLLLTLAYVQARQLRQLRDEADALRAQLTHLRKDRSTGPVVPAAPVGEDLGQPLTFHTRRDPGQSGPVDPEPQGQLSFGLNEPAPPPLAAADFISALNFPEDPEDMDGFRALRLGLRHPTTGPVIQAAQDVLTLLSQIGIYMDDLAPDLTRPDYWRRFALGERGGALGDLGGIRNETALMTAARAMRDDPVFRDASHHFLRRFDQLLSARIEDLSDTEVIHLVDTRSARAFMLLGRTTGIFD